MTRWWFSVVLLAIYLAVFHLWLALPRGGIVVSTLVTMVALSYFLARAARMNYFLNAWDALWHSTVILDVAVEGLVVPLHSGYSFYLCALAFAMVVGGYRAMLFRRARKRGEAFRADANRGGSEEGGSPAGQTTESALTSARMESDSWRKPFREVYERGVAAWKAGRRSARTMFDAQDKAFFASIGCTAQELFDFIDDFLLDGAPDFSTVLEVQAIRREYFLAVMSGQPSGRAVSTKDLPAKRDAVDGIVWLPRLIAKARHKLRGELPADLMYGCGGDRPFLRRMNLTLPEFLKLVWESGGDDRRIVDAVKRSAGMS